MNFFAQQFHLLIKQQKRSTDMGGRGASSGIGLYRDRHGKFVHYGDEYTTVLQEGRIKFVVLKSGIDAITAPRETRTKGRIYVTIGKNGSPKAITFFDRNGLRRAQIDLDHKHKGECPHKHGGYAHDRDMKMNRFDKWLVDYVSNLWGNR